MSGLTEQDREALNLAVDQALDVYDEGKGWDDRTLDAVVEGIVSRHIAADRERAAAEIEAWRDNADRASLRADDQNARTRSRVRFICYQKAARIVRGAGA